MVRNIPKREELNEDVEWSEPLMRFGLVQGGIARPLYQRCARDFDVEYDEGRKLLLGSNSLLAFNVDSLVSSLGMRIVRLEDLRWQEPLELLKKEFKREKSTYSNLAAFIIRSRKDEVSDLNQDLIKQILPYVEMRMGRARFPFMVRGLDVLRDARAKYGFSVRKREDFEVIEDERFSNNEDYFEESFNCVDERGIPVFDSEGGRYWRGSEMNGLFGLYVTGELDFCLEKDVLDSTRGGRLMLVKESESV